MTENAAESETPVSPSTPALAVYTDSVMTLEDVGRRLKELQTFVKAQMVVDEDYGIIPGTKKPTLYKPGAEKLCDFYGLTQDFQFLEKEDDWDTGRFAYTMKCLLTSKRTGTLIAAGVGECNSWEARYRYRWVWPREAPGNTPPDAPKNKKGQIRILNEDPYSLRNTILKMAKKRAMVDAVLSATRSSGLFTQDVEDLAANGAIDVEYTVKEAPKERTAGKTTQTDTKPAEAKKRANAASEPDTARPTADKDEATKAFLKMWAEVQPMVNREMVQRSLEIITQGNKLETCEGITIHYAAQFLEALYRAKTMGWPDKDCEKTFHAAYPTSGDPPTWHDLERMIQGVSILGDTPFDKGMDPADALQLGTEALPF